MYPWLFSLCLFLFVAGMLAGARLWWRFGWSMHMDYDTSREIPPHIDLDEISDKFQELAGKH